MSILSAAGVNGHPAGLGRPAVRTISDSRIELIRAVSRMLRELTPDTIRELQPEVVLMLAVWVNDGWALPGAADLVTRECGRRHSDHRRQARKFGTAYQALRA